MGTTTRKKIKHVGQQEFINAQTGEVEIFDVTSIEERDANFHKVWMRDFIITLDLVGNKKTKVCMWLVENINAENQVIGTFRSIAKASGTSVETVRQTFSVLKDADFLRRSQNGVYIVNPDIVFKGGKSKRMNVLHTYTDSSYEPMSDSERLEQLISTKAELDKKITELAAKIAREDRVSHDAVA